MAVDSRRPLAAPAPREARSVVATMRRTGRLLVAPMVILFLALTIFPFIYMIVTSFEHYDLASFEPPRFIGLMNYYRILFQDPIAGASVQFTTLLVVTALPAELLLGFGIALLVRGVIGERLIRGSILIPMMIPAVVVGIMWKMLFSFQYGPLNYFLSWFGVGQLSWLGDFTLAPISVIIMDIWQWTPFVFLVIYAGLQTVPQDLIDAAKVDGAGGWALTRYVEFPLVRPLIWVLVIIRLIDILKLFDIIYMTTYGGPGNVTYSYSFHIYRDDLSAGWDVGYGSALSILLLIVVTVLTNILIRRLRLKEALEL
jgi:multiple sugar transport system permease protein